MQPSTWRRTVWTTIGVLWLGGVAAGLGWLAVYQGEPGRAADTRPQWPAGSRLARDSEGPTLVMLVHPRCTCSSASVAELAELLARANERPRTYVVFIRPESMPDGWEQADLWQAAARIPGVTLISDDGGDEAVRFGAETSGQTFLYDPHGRLMFAGGTTGSRGHPGDNVGRRTLLALLDGERTAEGRSFVFGCSLFAPADPRPSDALLDHATEPD